MVSLQYLTGMSRAMGIESELEPVLSFPLGSNVINLIELARIYEAMTKGKLYLTGEDGTKDALLVIDRIEDVDGELIYEPVRIEKQILDPHTALQLTDIFRNVIQFGTGGYADRTVRVHSKDVETERQLRELDLGITLLGKTGTANRFTNSAFAGIVPGVTEKGDMVSVDNSYVVTAYVGFDDNTPMVRNDTHITGSGGALPVWSRFANAVLLHKEYAQQIDLIDFLFTGQSKVPLQYPELGQIQVPVDAKRGAIPDPTAFSDVSIVTFGEITNEGEWKPARFFRPYWQTEEHPQ
jgi:membrane peptidoglycan carboxypeptidase